MKKFFYACAAILCLVVAYHFGATNARGQSGSPVTGMSTVLTGSKPYVFVMTPNGECFVRGVNSIGTGFDPYPATDMGNFWSGATPAQQQSFGQLKARYR